MDFLHSQGLQSRLRDPWSPQKQMYEPHTKQSKTTEGAFLPPLFHLCVSLSIKTMSTVKLTIVLCLISCLKLGIWFIGSLRPNYNVQEIKRKLY